MQVIKHKNNIKDKLYNNHVTSSLISLEPGYITPEQLEIVRRLIKTSLNKTGLVIFPLICNKKLTKKSLGVPLGGGKGKKIRLYDVVATGQVIVKVLNGDKSLVKSALSIVKNKLPVKTRICQ